MTPPTRDEVTAAVAEKFYGGKILNNAHRGDVVEVIVQSALGADWRMVGLGWHPWDLQRGSGVDRVRIQVRQIAALQLWGKSKKLFLTFGWKKAPPSYFQRDNPDEKIEAEGWFCDLFVFGLHLEENPELADQADPSQWKFLVIPRCDLTRGQSSINLARALNLWQPVTWDQLPSAVELAIQKTRATVLA